MARRKGEPKQRVHIWLRERDIERIHELFDQNVGFSGAIQQMVSQCLAAIDAAVEAQASSPQVTVDVSRLGVQNAE